MRWWTRLAAKGLRAPMTRAPLGLVSGWQAPGDAWTCYEQAARDAYQRNPVAARAVRLVCEGAASAPLMVRGGDTRLARRGRALVVLAREDDPGLPDRIRLLCEELP